jgi:hypothetical protein
MKNIVSYSEELLKILVLFLQDNFINGDKYYSVEVREIPIK